MARTGGRPSPYRRVEDEILYVDNGTFPPLLGRAPGAGWIDVTPDGLAKEASKPCDEPIREWWGVLLFVGFEHGDQ